MPVKVPEKEFPWCTVCLVTVVLLCHSMVLLGNLQTSQGLKSIGTSTTGWSNVGLGLSESFQTDVDNVMANITEQLTETTAMLIQLEDGIDKILGSIGEKTDKSLMRHASLLQGNASVSWSSHGLPPEIEAEVKDSMQKIQEGLDMLLDAAEPALTQVGTWVATFGDKIQAGIEMFGTTVDLVQKLLDQIMSSASGGGGDPAFLEANTYTLFALSRKDEGITVQDLKDVSGMYSITALSGSKAEELHGKYDANTDGLVDTTEYSAFVTDPSVPNIMPVILLTYSKKLATVAGIVRQAKMRDEVAMDIVKYLQLVCAKNMTKVGWVSQTLTNASLPLEFTAAVMKNLAMAVDDPEVLTTTDVGATVIGTMTSLNSSHTMLAKELMMSTEWWASEGFDPQDQPICVERVSKWTAVSLLETGSATEITTLRRQLASAGANASVLQASLLESGSESSAAIGAAAGAAGRAAALRSRQAYYMGRHMLLKERYHRIKGTQAARSLFQTLLGGGMAYTANPKAEAAAGGQLAMPETLQFARWLSNNATTNAAIFIGNSFNASGQSSDAMDSFATQIQGMVKKTQSFISMLSQFSGPAGMANLRQQVQDFAAEGEQQLRDAISQYSLERLHGGKHKRSTVLLEAGKPGKSVAMMRTHAEQPVDDAMEMVGDNWQEIVGLLQTLEAILPDVIENLKLARKEVSAVSATLDSIFSTFKEYGKPIFDKVAQYYALIWIVWFVLLAGFTIGILIYGFWASGYFGGPKADVDDGYEKPATCWDRLCCCCKACSSCCYKCSGTECCFWSCILSMQVLVLVIFLIAIVLCLLAGVKLFISSTCSAVYVLGDNSICTQTLQIIKRFVPSFDAGVNIEIERVCARQELMTCAILGKKMKSSAILTSVGAILAAVFSFQLIIESAILHERAKWRRTLDKMVKGEAPDGDAASTAPTAP